MTLRKKDKKKLMIGGAAVSSLFLITLVIVALVGGKEEAPSMKLPGLEEYGETTTPFVCDGRMINDGETVYWDIGRPGNSTDLILVTGVQVLIAWSDDETPPATRPLYSNTPDTFILSAIGVPLLWKDDSADGNNTNVTEEKVIRISSTSQMGTTRVSLDIMNNPILLERDGNETSDEWLWNPEGSSQPGRTGFYINVTCIAGHIESSRPALLRYNDPGDEISMSVALSYKAVPKEIVDSWVANNSRS